MAHAQSTGGVYGGMMRLPKAAGRKLVRITHTSRRRAMYAARRWTVLRNRWEFGAETRRPESHVGVPQVEHNNSEIAEGQFFARDTGVACV